MQKVVPSLVPNHLIFAIAIVLLTLSTGLIAGCHSDKEVKVEEKQSIVVSTQKIAEEISGGADRVLHYSAVVTPYVQVDVAFKGSGYVDTIQKVKDGHGKLRPIQEGDFVRKGSVLARVRQADYLSKIKQQTAALNEVRVTDDRIRAEIAEAQAAVDQAKLDFDRSAGLFAKESLTKPEYDASKARLEVSQAKLNQSRAQLKINHATAARAEAGVEEVKLALKDCILVAPIEGVVLKKNIQEGSLVSSGTVAFTLADSSVVKVVFGVPDTELAKIARGQLLNVTSEALPNQIFSGRVSEVSPSADPKSRVFDVEVSVPNPAHLLKLGMVAALKVDSAGTAGTPAKAALSVPLTAVVRSSQNPDGYAVFVVEEQGGKYTARERPVQLGEAFGQKITVVDGIKSGDSVVTSGSTRIANGEEVRVLN